MTTCKEILAKLKAYEEIIDDFDKSLVALPSASQGTVMVCLRKGETVHTGWKAGVQTLEELAASVIRQLVGRAYYETLMGEKFELFLGQAHLKQLIRMGLNVTRTEMIEPVSVRLDLGRGMGKVILPLVLHVEDTLARLRYNLILQDAKEEILEDWSDQDKVRYTLSQNSQAELWGAEINIPAHLVRINSIIQRVRNGESWMPLHLQALITDMSMELGKFCEESILKTRVPGARMLLRGFRGGEYGLKHNEIGMSSELMRALNLKEGEYTFMGKEPMVVFTSLMVLKVVRMDNENLGISAVALNGFTVENLLLADSDGDVVLLTDVAVTEQQFRSYWAKRGG